MSLTLPPAHVVDQAQIQDYVLGLLPVEQRNLLERHVADCATCSRQLQQAKEVGLLVGTAVRRAGMVSPERLDALRPPAPRRRRLGEAPRQLALLGVVLMLFLGTVGLTQTGRAAWLVPHIATTAPTQAAQPTVTETQTPTVTASPTAISMHTTPQPAGWPAELRPLATPVTALALTQP
jgi:anti-sigma factor RsiW